MNHPMAAAAANQFSNSFPSQGQGTVPPAQPPVQPAPITNTTGQPPPHMVTENHMGGQIPVAQAAPVGLESPQAHQARPASIEQIMQEQAQQTQPGALGEQLRDQRLEQVLANSQAKTEQLQQTLASQQALIQQQLGQQTEYQKEQAEIARKNLEFQQQQALQQQQQEQLSPEQQYAWNENEMKQFGDARPVIEKTAAQIAAQMMADQNAAPDPKLSELEQRVNALDTSVSQQTQYTQQNFEAMVQQAASQYQLDVNQIVQDPDWAAMMAETQHTVPGSTVGSTFSSVVNSALNGAKSVAEVETLNHVFKAFSERKQAGGNQQMLGEVPAGVAQTRNTGMPPSANAQGAQAELQQLAARQATLRDQLIRSQRTGQRLDAESFQKEMLAIEQRQTFLENQLTNQG